MKDRLIFHCDMDAFFASIEELDKPWLKTQPMVVAGDSKRGIVTTANYEARKYGLHSAMPLFQAKKLCPQVHVVKVNKGKYSRVSRIIEKIFLQFTPLVEMLSLDEGYLDLTDSPLASNPVELAKAIKLRIFEETRLSLSIGISYNKFLAKLASDWEKPDGITIIKKEQVPDIILDMDISVIHGLGASSQQRFRDIGIEKVADLMDLSENFLNNFIGVQGTEIYQRIRGIDKRQVQPYRERKSISIENTFSEDINSLNKLKSILSSYADELTEDLIRKGFLTKTVSVKLKDSDFSSRTRSYSLSDYTDNHQVLHDKSIDLLEEFFNDKSYRLMGLTYSNLIKANIRQVSFFD